MWSYQNRIEDEERYRAEEYVIVVSVPLHAVSDSREVQQNDDHQLRNPIAIEQEAIVHSAAAITE